MSFSTHQTKLVEALSQAVYELATVTPHEPPDQHFSAPEFLLYSEGYYHALQMALRVMQLAAARQEMREDVEREREDRRKAA